MPQFVADETSETTTPTDELLQSRFQRNTAPWKNPKVTLGATLAIAGAVTATGFFIFNGNFQWPTIGGPTLGKSTASNDDMEPVAHPDGQVQTASMTGNLGPGLDQDANAPNPFTTTQKPDAKAKATATKGKVPAPSTPVSNPSTPRTSAYPTTTASTIPMTRRTVSNPTYSDYNTSTPVRSYPRASSTVAYSRPTVGYSRPTVSASPAPVTPSVSRPVATAAPQSAQDRRQAAIASTSTMGGSVEKSAAVQATTVAQASQGAPATQGYQEAAYLPSEEAVLNNIPQQLINRSQKALGRLLLGVAFLPGDTAALNGQPVEVAIEDPLKSGLPVGARIGAIVEFPDAGGQLKSAVIRLTAKSVVIGDAEYPIPAGTVILTGQNGQPLIAKRQGSGFFRSIGSTAKTVLSSAVGGLTTSILGNGGGLLSSLGGLLGGGQQPTPQQATEILALRENTAIQVNIVKPLSLPLADADLTSTQAATFQATDAQLMAIAAEAQVHNAQ